MNELLGKVKLFGVLVGLLQIWTAAIVGAVAVSLLTGYGYLVMTILAIGGVGWCAWLIILGIVTIINNI